MATTTINNIVKRVGTVMTTVDAAVVAAGRCFLALLVTKAEADFAENPDYL